MIIVYNNMWCIDCSYNVCVVEGCYLFHVSRLHCKLRLL